MLKVKINNKWIENVVQMIFNIVTNEWVVFFKDDEFELFEDDKIQDIKWVEDDEILKCSMCGKKIEVIVKNNSKIIKTICNECYPEWLEKTYGVEDEPEEIEELGTDFDGSPVARDYVVQNKLNEVIKTLNKHLKDK